MTAIHPAPLLADLQDAMTQDGVTTILVDLFVLFAAAKFVGELFEALRQPQVVGELLAGVLIGPHVLGLVGAEGEIVLEVIAELGVIILLFTVGLETSARISGRSEGPLCSSGSWAWCFLSWPGEV
jgi:NhaP-type Na+/H+ or K+/H+ antiporter